MLAMLRSGAFVTRQRMFIVGFALLLAFTVALAWLAVTSDGRNDALGRPLGTDFANVYAAGSYVLDGAPQAPFDPARQYAREQAIFGATTPFYGWHYPPFFLFVAAALAMLPYGAALLVWQGGSFLLYLAAIRAITHRAGSHPDPSWLLLAAAFPAVFVNFGHGHNGLLTAALMGGALAVLDRRPLIAGVLLGLLAYKPQFGILIPLVLMVTGRWQSFAAAAATVLALFVATVAAFGVPTWEAFFASGHFTRTVVLENGETGWQKIQSVFSWVRMWGGPVWLAYTVQAVAANGVAVAVGILWRMRADFALQAAALVIGTILAIPYSLDYDMMALAPAIAFLAVHGLRHGFADYEKTALAGLWLAPLLARSIAAATLLPVAVPVMAAAFILVLARAARAGRINERRSAALPAGAIAAPHGIYDGLLRREAPLRSHSPP